MISINGNNIKVIFQINGKPIGGGDDRIWKLDPSGYLVGEDGKYYQRLYDDSEYEDNNPIPDLNDEWVVDTVSGDLNIDKNYDYFMSDSNYHKANEYSQFKVSWSGLNEITFLYRSKAESNYDYLVINGMDRPKFAFSPTPTTEGIIAHTKGKQSDTYSELKLECDEGEHFIWFCYRKDSSGDTAPDRAFVGIPNNYISGTLYEKQGSELKYEYIKSDESVPSRPGYVRFKYYKTYFTPDEATEIKTDDYILGDEVPETPITRNYLRFVNTNTKDITLNVFNNGQKFIDLKYSIDFEEKFIDVPVHSVNSFKIVIPVGKTVWFKANGMSENTDGGSFTTSDSCECHGNIMSLLGDDFENNFTITTKNCFHHLFQNNWGITTAPELPATTLANNCYTNMFNTCAALTTAPELPATTLADNCYQNMFQNCSKLTAAPELPATTLKQYCYNKMFSGCSKLTAAPELPATTLANNCYDNMFYGCTSLTAAPELPATTLGRNCYYYMFYGCSKLTTAPTILPAESAMWACYNYMFYGCTSLTTAPEIKLKTTEYACCAEMFKNCTALTKAPSILPATNLTTYAYSAMFYGCTALTESPILPAKSIGSYCYNGMFDGCSSLTKITMLADTWPAGNTNSWVNAVPANGTFIKSATATWTEEYGDNNIPTGWTVQTYSE